MTDLKELIAEARNGADVLYAEAAYCIGKESEQKRLDARCFLRLADALKAATERNAALERFAAWRADGLGVGTEDLDAVQTAIQRRIDAARKVKP